MSKKTLPNPYPTVRQPKLSRIPQNFPKMKYRARKRTHRNHVHWCLPQDQLGIAHIAITPVTNRFDALIKRAMESVRHIALGFEALGSAADRSAAALEEVAPNLSKGASPTGFLIDEAFREDVHTAYKLSPLAVSPPAHLPTAVLNPNVRKRR